MRAMFLALSVLLSACASAPKEAALPAKPPIVIAHRGASGERPEHTLMAYRLAIQQGADFIEPDLVMTKDGVLVARHENEISETTDVAAKPEFAARKRTQIIDGETITGWFTEDFTLAELKSLRTRERLPQLRPDNTAFDGQEAIPTLEEILQLLAETREQTGRNVGIYPETKHPSHFQQIGLAMEAPLAAMLTRYGYDGPEDAAFIQSFEVENLKTLNRLTNVRLVQLMSDSGGPADQPGVTYAQMAADAGLKEIARYADGIGAAKALIIPRDADDFLGAPTDLVARAHAAGLLVHAWTFRSENVFLPAELRSIYTGTPLTAMDHGDAEEELKIFFATGLDGVFADFPATALSVRAQR